MNARLSLLLAVALMTAAAIGAPSAHAISAVQDITVNTTSDTSSPPAGMTSLREAVDTANADGSGDVYNIHLPAGTYLLNSELEISHGSGFVNLMGAGARSTILRAHGRHGMFVLDPSPNKSEFDDLTITGGATFDNQSGGGIYSSRQLDLHRVTVSGNTAQTGGGISNHGGLGLFDSTVSANSATLQNPADDTGGGGIYNAAGIYVVNSTISGNSVTGNASHPARGGGILNLAAAHDSEIYFSTFAGNDVSGSGADGRDLVSPGHLADGTTPFYLYGNSNIYASEPAGGASGPHNCVGPSATGASGDASFDSGGSCAGQHNIDAKLQPLANNGGPTDTYALSGDSPAIDVTGDCTGVAGGVSTDQRGLPRPTSGDQTCDAGAYELQPGNDLGLTMSGSPDPVVAGTPATFTITVAATGPSGDATQPTVTTAVPAGASLVSITPSQGSCTGTVCSLGALGNGATAAVTLVVRPAAPGTLAASAAVSGPRPETSSANNSAGASVAVAPAPPAVAGGGRPQGDQQQTPPVVISALHLKPAHFRAAKGTHVSFRLSQRSRVAFKIQSKHCVKHKRCRWRTAGHFKRTGKVGVNRFKFVPHGLKPGAYRLVLTPAGHGAKSRRANFSIHR